MITGNLKNKIDALWDTFWSGGISNPLDVLEQITYLMFIRDLGAIDDQRKAAASVIGLPYTSLFEGNEVCRWDTLRQLPPQEMYQAIASKVFPFIKNLDGNEESAFSRYMGDALFKIPTPQMLTDVIDQLEEVYKLGDAVQDNDTKGDIYEYMLGKLTTSGTLGQFRTPRHIIRMMVEMIQPTLKDTICDPACGTSGFLVEAGQWVKQHFADELHQDANDEHFNHHMFTGRDMDRVMLRIGAMNMMRHGIADPDIDYADSLSDQNGDENRYSVVLANPPFTGSINGDIISGSLSKTVKTKKTELLFLALFLRIMRLGGRAAVIVPDGVLFGSSNAHKGIRKEIIDKHRLQAVISMPSGVFKPYAGVSTAILFFTKTNNGGTDNVWFYDMKADGFSLDDKRNEIKANDIPDIIARYRNLDGEKDRERTEQSFFVPVDEIRANGYDLSINKYKKVEYVKEDLPAPSELMAEIQQLETEIQSGMAELQKMLGAV